MHSRCLDRRRTTSRYLYAGRILDSLQRRRLRARGSNARGPHVPRVLAVLSFLLSYASAASAVVLGSSVGSSTTGLGWRGLQRLGSWHRCLLSPRPTTSRHLTSSPVPSSRPTLLPLLHIKVHGPRLRPRLVPARRACPRNTCPKNATLHARPARFHWSILIKRA